MHTERCDNCGGQIGNLEQAFVWREHTVCRKCYDVLQKEPQRRFPTTAIVVCVATAVVVLGGIGWWLLSSSPGAQRASVADGHVDASSSESSPVVQLHLNQDKIDANARLRKGNTVATLSNVTFVADPKFGSVGAFDGQRSGISLGTKPEYQLTTAVTLCAIVRIDKESVSGPVIGMDDWQGAGQAKGYVLRVFGSRVDFTVGIDNQWCSVGSPDQLKRGEWHRIAGTYDGRLLRLFIDGKEVASKPQTGRIGISNFPLSVGIGAFDTTRCFDGLIARVAVFGKAATLKEMEDSLRN